MCKFKKTMMVLLVIIATSPAFSAEVKNVSVLDVGSYGSGQVFISIDEKIEEEGCSRMRIDVHGSHEQVRAC